MKKKSALVLLLAILATLCLPLSTQAFCEECYFVDIGLGGEPKATCLDLAPLGFQMCIAISVFGYESCITGLACVFDFPSA